jgi:tRNA(Ile)-lysidine synthase
LRLAVGLSGGADSVALLRVLAERSRELGLVMHVAHLHHGLRGAEADMDRDFCRQLAERLDLPFHEARVDTAAAAIPDRATAKPAETIEEAARRLRYAWFRELMASGAVDVVATAHTRDDQAETVLARFLRGAWTEGLSGIYPVVRFPEGRILRPLLASTRAEIEACLGALMAELAREDEAWWEAETAQVADQIVLPGRPVRGGGRAAGEGIAIEVTRLMELPVALQRRLLRHAAGRLGAAPDFEATEALRNLAITGRAGQKCELAGLIGERTHRELRMSPGAAGSTQAGSPGPYRVAVPGKTEAPEWGIWVLVSVTGSDPPPIGHAVLRPWKPGDRVRLRHSGGPRKIKEVLERMHVSGSARANWPVLEMDGRILWMQGVQLEPEPGIEVSVRSLTGEIPPAAEFRPGK